MDCSTCKKELASLGEIMFFCKEEKDVHMTLKPEVISVVKHRSLLYVEEGKKVKVLCKFCKEEHDLDTVLGKDLPFGPNGCSFPAFGTEKVIILRLGLTKKNRWWQEKTTDRFASINKRGVDDYFPRQAEGPNDASMFQAPDTGPIKFASSPEDFDWTNLLEKTSWTARHYQVECLVEGLQRDLVAVLPTGAGKTLIASMLLRRMRELNQEKMGLFVVESTPLVFQQEKAIRSDVGLRVLPLCGQNKTQRSIRDLYEDKTDVLVATAGLVVNMLEQHQLFLSMFSCVVLDEAHHAVGGAHKYSQLLKKILQVPQPGPRILGLTASPFRVKTPTKGRNKLGELIDTFKTEAIFKPRAPRLEQESPEWRTVPVTAEQLRFQEKVINSYQEIALLVYRDFPDHEDFPLKIPESKTSLVPTSEIGMMKGQISAIEDYFNNTAKVRGKAELVRNLGKLRALVESMEIADSISISSALELLEENSVDNVDSYDTKEGVSQRLQTLRKLLAETKADSKVLVFVSTRQAARRLVKVVDKEFPDLKANQVVGHGGWDGQEWVGVQDNIIDDFRCGRCRLLVCTSVLEEGIDVSSCDLVIRYTGVKTLIQFIQSRGRARKQGSRFIVLVTDEEGAKSQEIEEEEKIMDMILEDHCNTVDLPSDKTKEIIQAVSQSSGVGDLDLSLKKEKYSYLPEHSIIEFFVEGTKRDNETAVRSSIEEVLQDSVHLTVSRIEVNNSKAVQFSGCNHLFDRKDHLVLCHVANPQGENSLDKYHRLCEGWNFRLTDNPISTVARIQCKGASCPKLEWKMGELAVGQFTDRHNFIQKYSFREEDMSLELSQTGHLGTIKIGDLWKLQCSFLKTSVLEFGLASWDKKVCCLYVPLESVPVLFRVDLDGNRRREVVHQFLENVAKHPVLVFKIHLDQENDWLNLRQVFSSPSVIPFPVFDTKIGVTIQETEISTNEDDEDENLSAKRRKIAELDFETKRSLLFAEWSALVLSTDLVMNAPAGELRDIVFQIREKFVQGQPLEGMRIGIACSFSNRRHCSYWRPFQTIFKQEIKKLSGVTESTLNCLVTPTPSNHVQLLRLVVTPSRRIFQPGVPVFTSRLTRMLGNSHNLVVVAFRDENMQKRLNDVSQRIEDVLKDGIEIDGRTLHFLCASASQIRDYKAFFVEVQCKSEVYSLRKLIIENPEQFTSSAKYLSRLGLFCTADKPTLDIGLDLAHEIEDIEAESGALVTDGSGFINQSTAEKVFGVLEEPVPSAFQFRYSGMKGVLVTVPDSFVEAKEPGKQLLYRESQDKFASEHCNMGIVKTAKIYPLRLNREVITLLEALFLRTKEKETWHLPQNLVNLQETFLDSQASMFTDALEAEETLMQYLPSQEIKDTGECFDLKIEPYFFGLLRYCHKFGLLDLCRKTNIPVKNGCLVMGIPDFTDSLNEGEIFIKVCQEGKEPKIIEGSVIMYRNPCLHPGDLRLVTAVDRQELHDVENVLVLPTKDQTQSLSAMCSGGDLDGDQFSVIWDKELVPPRRLQHKALDYGKLEGSPPPAQTEPCSQDMLARFYVQCMENEMLGRVAHMHLALSDQLEAGAADPMAMKLAESQAVAVDYPKTGIAPKVPKEAIEKVTDLGYPDFMQKKTSESYPSNKILGKLFQSSKSYVFEFEISEEEHRKIPLDQSLLVDGYKDHLEIATQVYRDYIVDMKYLMHQFSLKSEEEVVLGKPIKLHSLLDSDREKVLRSLKENFENLKKKYNEKIKNLAESKIEALVSACYYVAYNQNLKHESRPFLSFPWVVGEYLRSIKRRTFHSLPPKTSEEVINKKLGDSAKNYFLKKIVPELKDVVKTKEKLFAQVESSIKSIGEESGPLFEAKPYGSTSVFLCESESDIDVCVEVLPAAFNSIFVPDKDAFSNLDKVDQQRHFLQNCISPAVDQVLNEKSELIQNEIPVIKGIIGNTSVDISTNTVGVEKTKKLRSIFCNSPELFVVFCVIIKWARYSSLVKYLEKDNPPFLTAEMYAMVIYTLKLNEFTYNCPASEGSLYKDLSKILHDIKDFSIVGERIREFFGVGKSLPKEDLTIDWGIEGAQLVHIPKAHVYSFSKACSQALHCLLATQSVEAVCKNALDCTETQSILTKKLPLSLSHSIGLAPEFHARRLTHISGAKVEISEEPGEDRLVLTAEGSRASMAELRVELDSLSRTKRALVIGVPTKQASRYFLAGSTLMLVRNSRKKNCRLGFSDSKGTYQLSHAAQQRSTPVIKFETADSLDPNDWRQQICTPSLTETMQRQLDAFPLNNQHLVKGIELTSRFGTFYVIDIDASLPKTQKTMELAEFQATCEKGRHMRKALEREHFSLPRGTKKKPQFQMVQLRKGRGQVDIADNKKSKLVRNKKQKSGISMSYNTGTSNPVVEKYQARPQAEKSNEIYKEVLANLGYMEGQGDRKNPRVNGEEHWKVQINASTGYEITLNLDSNMEFISIGERNLSWVHATLLHGTEMQDSKNLFVPENDIRFHVQTSEQIRPGSNLFKFVYPEGDTSNSPLVTEGPRKKPVFAREIDQALKVAIPMAKHSKQIELFNKDGVIASIVTGTTWLGDNLSQDRQYCDLSLYWHPEDVIECLKNPSQMENFVDKVMKLSLEMSDELTNVIRKSLESV